MPEPEAPADDLGWGTFGNKKDKKKKTKNAVEEVAKVEAKAEDTPAPVAEQEPAVDDGFGWSSFGTSKKDKKKKVKSATEEDPKVEDSSAPDPKPESPPKSNEFAGWGSVSTSMKDKKKKGKKEEDPPKVCIACPIIPFEDRGHKGGHDLEITVEPCRISMRKNEGNPDVSIG